MRTKQNLERIILEIYTKMYKETVPVLDFDEAVSSGLTSKPNWFMDYYLGMDRQKEIFDVVVKKHGCSRYEIKKLDSAVWLGCSPSGIKKGSDIK